MATTYTTELHRNFSSDLLILCINASKSKASTRDHQQYILLDLARKLLSKTDWLI